MRNLVDAFDQELGKRIRARRLLLKMPQERLGALLGISFQQVQKYEKGTNRVSGHRLVDVAKHLQTTTSELLGEGKSGKPAQASVISEFFAIPHAAELAAAYLAIPAGPQRRLVIDVAREIAGKQIDRGKLRSAA